MPSPIFSAGTFPPYDMKEEIFQTRYDKILKVSREKYAKSRDIVVARINKTVEDIEKQESDWEKKKEAFKQKKQEEKKKANEEKMAQKKKEAEERMKKNMEEIVKGK